MNSFDVSYWLAILFLMVGLTSCVLLWYFCVSSRLTVNTSKLRFVGLVRYFKGFEIRLFLAILSAVALFSSAHLFEKAEFNYSSDFPEEVLSTLSAQQKILEEIRDNFPPGPEVPRLGENTSELSLVLSEQNKILNQIKSELGRKGEVNVVSDGFDLTSIILFFLVLIIVYLGCKWALSKLRINDVGKKFLSLSVSGLISFFSVDKFADEFSFLSIDFPSSLEVGFLPGSGDQLTQEQLRETLITVMLDLQDDRLGNPSGLHEEAGSVFSGVPVRIIRNSAVSLNCIEGAVETTPPFATLSASINQDIATFLDQLVDDFLVNEMEHLSLLAFVGGADKRPIINQGSSQSYSNVSLAQERATNVQKYVMSRLSALKPQSELPTMNLAVASGPVSGLSDENNRVVRICMAPLH